MSDLFKLTSKYKPMGDQPRAIAELVQNIKSGRRHNVLLGVTGSGKTFTLANTIQQIGKPTLIIAPNKTLAAQLYEEFKEFFPENAVEYFVSYYDYYQPEAYVPHTDTFIEKDSAINEEIDRMRHSATHSLLTRKDTIIISSVSFLYGLGSPELYRELIVMIVEGTEVKRNELLKRLIDIQYQRNDVDFHRGTFRVRGDVVEIFPAYAEEQAIRIEFFGDMVESITEVDPIRGVPIRRIKLVNIYPATHYVTESNLRKRAINTILEELRERLSQLASLGKSLEAKRLEQRTLYDVEMLEEIGHCKGIENYSRHLTQRPPGAPPPTLMEYFPDGFMMVMDESHVSVPQLGAMFKGDQARKQSLVEYGFRLPSAMDNRPLKFDEWFGITEKRCSGILYVSATPADYEMNMSGGEIVEQIIRPTGLLDPVIDMKPAKNQVQDLLEEIKKRVNVEPEKKSRVLVTTLTKKSSEDLTTFLLSKGIKVKYLHSDIETLERIEILRDLRLGIFDVLIGINLLREGLDLPEVSLVAILDADKEGFLRSERSLIQTIGRAARNAEGRVILYADKVTDSIEKAVSETDRRRAIQADYNREHNITPRTVIRDIKKWDQIPDEKMQVGATQLESATGKKKGEKADDFNFKGLKTLKDVRNAIEKQHKSMVAAAKDQDFEEAARLRDRVKALKTLELQVLQNDAAAGE
ncbi:MAG: excinuclease ABC subunit UvrB [Proteobacteria bacterium]|nr:MAG: excinuclease ABC subunit UvrB [Pseudomonadota bacterium]